MSKTRKPKTMILNHEWAWNELKIILKSSKKDSEGYAKEYAASGEYAMALDEAEAVHTIGWILETMKMSDGMIKGYREQMKKDAKKTAKK